MDFLLNGRIGFILPPLSYAHNAPPLKI